MAIQDDFTINPNTKVIRHDTTKSTVYTSVEFYSFLQDTFDEPGFLSYEIPIRFNTPTSFTMLNGWFLDDGDGSNILQFLTGGGIDTLGYATVTDPILMIDLDYGTLSFELTDKDLTVTQDGTDIGPLLSYKDDYPSASTARIWVRDTNTGSATTVPGEIIDVTAGNGNYTTTGYSAIGDNIYHNLFTIAAFPVALDADANPQVYVYQNHPSSDARVRIAEWSHLSNWGDGGTQLMSRGSIDVLITTQLGGTLIDGGNISTFVRQTGDSFTFVESTLTTSGRTPIATETSSDEVNITVGETYFLVDNGLSNMTNDFKVGDVITDVPIGTSDTDLVPPSWYAEIFAITEYTATDTGLLTLKALNGVIADGDAVYVKASQKATANGTVGDTLLSYTGTDPTVLGQIIDGDSSTAARLLRGIDSGENKLVLQDDPTGVTGTGRNLYYIDYSSGETLTGTGTGGEGALGTTDAVSTTLISGFNDITVAHINGTITVASGAVFTSPGERISWTGGEGIHVETNSNILTIGNVSGDEPADSDTILGDISASGQAQSGAMTHTNTEDFAFTLQTAFDYSVFIEGGTLYNAGRSLSDIYAYLQYYLRDGQNIANRIIYTSNGSTITELAAEEYIKAQDIGSFNASKTAPYGTIAGGVFFSAQGVWLQGMSSADNNNIRLLDNNAILHTPELSMTITVSNTKADDRIAIFLDADQDSLPDKDMYVSHGSLNALGDSTIDHHESNTGSLLVTAFPNDTPAGGTAGGTIIMVDNTLNKQHRYRYDSFNNIGGDGDDGQVVLPAQIGPTASDGTTANQTLNDTVGTPFTPGGTANVEVGDIIHRTDGTLGFCYVTEVTDANTLQTTLFEDTSATAAERTWTSGDTYEIHSLVKTYIASDNFFIPYMDEISINTSDVEVNLTFVSNRFIILEVRNVEAATEIVPFKTTGTINSGGYTQGVIRNEDTVFTP